MNDRPKVTVLGDERAGWVINPGGFDYRTHAFNYYAA